MNVYLLWSQAVRGKDEKSQNIPQDGWKLMDILLLSTNTEYLDARTDILNHMKICITVDLLTADQRETDT
jgi:hypothetical protein